MSLDLSTYALAKGSHRTREAGMCAMELVAFMAGEPHSDGPRCASAVVRRLVIQLNDRWGDKDRQRLRPYLARIIGTAGDAETEQRRRWLCADWAVRHVAPIALDAAGASNWADLLRELPELVDADTVARGECFARFAQHAAGAAYSTVATGTNATAYAASAYAADAASTHSVGGHPDAAYAAADAADAADAAEWTEELKVSSLDLLDRLIRVTEASR